MMTPETRAWLDGFRARYNLMMPLGADEHLIAERAEKAAVYAEENIPPRFADALPTIPEVEAWVASVIRSSVTGSQARGQRVATIQRGPSLLLLGPTGVGKTHEAYGAMRAISLFGIYDSWLVISAPDLYARLRPRHGVDSEAEFKSIAEAPGLVVDDVGASKQTEFVEDVNYRLVNRRYELAMPTMFTSNLPAKSTEKVPGLDRILGDRVVSRLREMTRRVSVKGEDRRRAA
jgi:DNA replication protein DnaC